MTRIPDQDISEALRQFQAYANGEVTLDDVAKKIDESSADLTGDNAVKGSGVQKGGAPKGTAAESLQLKKLKAEDEAAVADPNAAGAKPPSADVTATGAALYDNAVRQADLQQDAGENWTRFADRDATQLPASVEEVARAEREQTQRVEEQTKISAAEIQNQLTLQSGVIRG